MATFPLRRSALSLPLLLPLAPRRPTATLVDERIEVRMGLHGSADVPLEAIERIGTMRWPWWGGVGARITRGMVGFVGSSGTVIVLELSRPLTVRAPMSWSARRIGIGVEDPEGFMAAVAEARREGTTA